MWNTHSTRPLTPPHTHPRAHTGQDQKVERRYGRRAAERRIKAREHRRSRREEEAYYSAYGSYYDSYYTGFGFIYSSSYYGKRARRDRYDGSPLLSHSCDRTTSLTALTAFLTPSMQAPLARSVRAT